MANDTDSTSESIGIHDSQASTSEIPQQNSKENDIPMPNFPQAFGNIGFASQPNFDNNSAAFPMMMPQSLFSAVQQPQQMYHGGSGIYLVPVSPFPAYNLPPGQLIPLTYNFPSSTSVQGVGDTSSDTERSATENRDAPAQEGLRQRHGDPVANEREERQNQQPLVGRRVININLDPLLIMKLAVVVFVFNQDGSKERLFVLLVLATLVYLYQTGALAPLLQRLTQSVRQARLPAARAAQVERPVQPENLHDGENNQDAPNDEGQQPQPQAQPPAHQIPDIDGANGANEPAEQNQGWNWWGIVKELQMVVVGFVASLLPGFHHVD